MFGHLRVPGADGDGRRRRHPARGVPAPLRRGRPLPPGPWPPLGRPNAGSKQVFAALPGVRARPQLGTGLFGVLPVPSPYCRKDVEIRSEAHLLSKNQVDFLMGDGPRNRYRRASASVDRAPRASIRDPSRGGDRPRKGATRRNTVSLLLQ